MTSPTRKLTPQEMADAADLLMKMAHNDKLRPHLAPLIKAVDPNAAKGFTDVFVTQQIAALRKEIADGRLKDQSDKATEIRNKERDDLKKARGYSDSQMTEVQGLYDTYGSWEAAAAVYKERNPPDDPTMKPPPEIQEMGSTWEFPTVPGPDGKMLTFKDYVANPRKYSNNTALQMITDFKRGKLPSAFTR